MRNGFLVLGIGLRGVWGSILRKSSNSSVRCSGSDSSLEYSILEE